MVLSFSRQLKLSHNRKERQKGDGALLKREWKMTVKSTCIQFSDSVDRILDNAGCKNLTGFLSPLSLDANVKILSLTSTEGTGLVCLYVTVFN